MMMNDAVNYSGLQSLREILIQTSWLKPRLDKSEVSYHFDRKLLTKQVKQWAGVLPMELIRPLYAQFVVDHFTENPTLDVCMKQLAQFSFFACFIYLQNYEFRQGREGVLVSDIWKILEAGAQIPPKTKLTNITRVRQMMETIANMGMVEQLSEKRTRSTRYLVGPGIYGVFERYYGNIVEIFERIGFVTRPAGFFITPTMLGQIMGVYVICYRDYGYTLVEDYPEIKAVMDIDYGYVIMMQLMTSVKNHGTHYRMSCNLSEFSEKLAIPRTTVKRTLIKLQDYFGMVLGRGGEDIIVSEAIVQRLDQWIVQELCWDFTLLSQAMQNHSSIKLGGV